MKQEEPKLSEVLEVMNASFSRLEDQMATKEDLKELRLDLRKTEHRIRDHMDAKFADTNALIRGHEVRIGRLEGFHSV